MAATRRAARSTSSPHARPRSSAAYVDVNYGNYNLTEIEAEVGGGVSDTLAIRFAGTRSRAMVGRRMSRPATTSAATPSRSNAAIERQAARFSALWTPSDTFQALFVGDASFDDSQVPAYKTMGYTNTNGSCTVPLVAGFNGGRAAQCMQRRLRPAHRWLSRTAAMIRRLPSELTPTGIATMSTSMAAA